MNSSFLKTKFKVGKSVYPSLAKAVNAFANDGYFVKCLE